MEEKRGKMEDKDIFGDIGHNRLDRLIGPWELDWIDKIDRIETGVKSEE